jgi:hypothetical protein
MNTRRRRRPSPALVDPAAPPGGGGGPSLAELDRLVRLMDSATGLVAIPVPPADARACALIAAYIACRPPAPLTRAPKSPGPGSTGARLRHGDSEPAKRRPPPPLQAAAGASSPSPSPPADASACRLRPPSPPARPPLSSAPPTAAPDISVTLLRPPAARSRRARRRTGCTWPVRLPAAAGANNLAAGAVGEVVWPLTGRLWERFSIDPPQ